MHDEAAEHLAENMRRLREARGLTQAQVAKLAGVPRATWTNVESGAANPTLSVLLKIAAAFHVRLEELLAMPRTAAVHVPAAGLRSRRRGKVAIRQLLPEPLPGLELERMELPAGASMTGIPHTPGTREYLTCESGRIELSLAGEKWVLEPGDVVAFRGDQRHGYRNLVRTTTIAYSAVTFAVHGG